MEEKEKEEDEEEKKEEEDEKPYPYIGLLNFMIRTWSFSTFYVLDTQKFLKIKNDPLKNKIPLQITAPLM